MEFNGTRDHYKTKKAEGQEHRWKRRGAGLGGQREEANPVCGTADATVATQKDETRKIE